MRSGNETIATAGWCLYAGCLATRSDEMLDLDEIETLMNEVVGGIHAAPNRVRYQMNSFIISVGCYVKPLLAQARKAAKQIGPVSVDMGDTACKTPLATEYIAKVEKMGRVGRKRSTLKC